MVSGAPKVLPLLGFGMLLGAVLGALCYVLGTTWPSVAGWWDTGQWYLDIFLSQHWPSLLAFTILIPSGGYAAKRLGLAMPWVTVAASLFIIAMFSGLVVFIVMSGSWELMPQPIELLFIDAAAGAVVTLYVGWAFAKAVTPRSIQITTAGLLIGVPLILFLVELALLLFGLL